MLLEAKVLHAFPGSHPTKGLEGDRRAGQAAWTTSVPGHEELWSFVPKVVVHSSQGGSMGRGGCRKAKPTRGSGLQCHRHPDGLGSERQLPDTPLGFLSSASTQEALLRTPDSFCFLTLL